MGNTSEDGRRSPELVAVDRTTYLSQVMEQLHGYEATTIVRIARSHGATEVRLLGSRAIDQAISDSDLALLVTMAKGRSLLDLVAIKQDIEDELDLRTDVVTPSALLPDLRDQVLAEAILLG